MEHAGDNIDVTLICPGPVKSNITGNAFIAENTKVGASHYVIYIMISLYQHSV